MHDDFQHTLFLLSQRYLINKYRRHVLPHGEGAGVIQFAIEKQVAGA